MSDVDVKFSKDEALVLFEFLSRYAENDILGTEDSAEINALSSLQAKLEKLLVEPFQENYSELLESARDSIRNETGTNSKKEKGSGKIALWLEPTDIEFISNEWRKIPEEIDESDREKWSRVAFRCMTALHKANIAYEAKHPSEKEKYKKTT